VGIKEEASIKGWKIGFKGEAKARGAKRDIKGSERGNTGSDRGTTGS
jgi:hypothetical protein